MLDQMFWSVVEALERTGDRWRRWRRRRGRSRARRRR